MAHTITDASFEQDVLKSDKLVMIDFWATWCGPCVALAPTIDALSKEYDGKVVIGKVDVDANPDISVKYGIRNIPTVLFIKNGEVVDKVMGNAPKGAFEVKLNKHM
jgi:thioredoxin 1